MTDVLLVEDETDLRELLAELLTASGCRVRCATNGEAGLKALDERYPQVVITDMQMPQLDGPGMILRMFIENLGRENIPVVMLSAHPSLPGVAAAVGTPYFLMKPFELDELLAMIARAMTEAIPPRRGLARKSVLP